MDKILRHCQPKGTETDRLNLSYPHYRSTRWMVNKLIVYLLLDYLNDNILNIIKFHPTAAKGEGASKLAALIRTYLTDFKGWQIQSNIVSAKNLIEA